MKPQETERQLYESGLSLRIVAQLKGVGRTTVARRVRQQGGTLRPLGTNI